MEGIWTDRKGNGWYVEARGGTMLEPDQRAGRELLSGPCWVPPCESSLSQDPVCRARERTKRPVTRRHGCVGFEMVRE